MRIEEVNIANYGPLENFHLSCDNINLIYGRNETGKTALIDAITFAPVSLENTTLLPTFGFPIRTIFFMGSLPLVFFEPFLCLVSYLSH